jgi:hypothetical protein
MQNNRKVAGTGVTDGDDTLILSPQPVFARQKPVMACNFAKIPCSQAGDRFAHDCSHHHPVLGVKPSQAISQFVRGNRGFLASGASLNLSLLGDEPAFAGLSLRRKFPFPAHGGDRFDDWVVGPQFEPN